MCLQKSVIWYHIRLSSILSSESYITLQWRHNGRDGVSNHEPHDCLLNRLFRCRSKKTSKLRATGLYAWNSPLTGEFPAQMASNAENDSIWWSHHLQSHSWQRMCAVCNLISLFVCHPHFLQNLILRLQKIDATIMCTSWTLKRHTHRTVPRIRPRTWSTLQAGVHDHRGYTSQPVAWASPFGLSKLKNIYIFKKTTENDWKLIYHM